MDCTDALTGHLYVCPCLLVIHKSTKVTGGVADHCPPLAGGRGVERHKQESWHTYNLNIYVFVQTIAHYAMNGEPDVGFKMKFVFIMKG